MTCNGCFSPHGKFLEKKLCLFFSKKNAFLRQIQRKASMEEWIVTGIQAYSHQFIIFTYMVQQRFYVIIHARNIPTSLSTQKLSQWMNSPPYLMAAILWHVDKIHGLQARIEETSPAHTSVPLPSLNYFHTFNHFFLQWLKLYTLNLTLSDFVKKYLF